MAKPRIQYTCTNCGAGSLKWVGKCPSCEEWNTFEEEVITKPANNIQTFAWAKKKNSATLLKTLTGDTEPRIEVSSDPELSRVLGGGIVRGSLILVGGQPGIGKSTLLLQLACSIDRPVLYVSGEESPGQIKMRADRIGNGENTCYILPETNVNNILKQAEEIQPELLVIDSIQTLHADLIQSASGSVSQIRECTAQLQDFAKKTNTPVFIIGHITKEGYLAGPKVLEHIVDVVLQFEGDRNYIYRILRATKNRFGSTDEIGIYEMKSSGLIPIIHPGQILLSQSEENFSGSCIAATVEGMRPLMIEVQALVSNAIYGNPQRSSTGFDNRRLGMLLAVLEKKCGIFFSQQDVFLNIAGGLRATDPATDLAVVAALLSSLHDISVDKKICFAGEVALSGEVRAVNRIELRIQEAARMGFDQIFIPLHQRNKLTENPANIRIHGVNKVGDLAEQLFA